MAYIHLKKYVHDCTLLFGIYDFEILIHTTQLKHQFEQHTTNVPQGVDPHLPRHAYAQGGEVMPRLGL